MESKSHRVLDVGCNTGEFSIIASQAEVVAIDYDSVVIDSLYSRAVLEKLNILPLVVDFTRPTSGIGWRNHECSSFIERTHGKFDMVFMLAVIHHMIVSERIPLDEILKLVSEVTNKFVIIEYVDTADSVMQILMRGMNNLYNYLNREYFEISIQPYFAIV